MCRVLCAGAFLLWTILLVHADTPKTAAEKAQAEEARWTVDDVVLSESASGFEISPDCRYVAWVKSVQDKDKGSRVSHIVRSSLTAKEDVEMTRGPDSCIAPKWSRDGKLLAFITSRPNPKAKSGDDDDDEDKGRAAAKGKEPKPQIWLMNPFGGEPWPLTDSSRGVLNYDWAGADTLIFAAQEDPTLRENTLKDEKKDDTIVVDDDKTEPPVRLFKVSVKDKKVTRLTDNADRIASFALSPDGRRAVAVHERSLSYIFDNKVKPVVFLHDLSNGERKQVFADRKFNVARVRWTRDGKGFYAASELTSHPQFVHATITELYHYDLATSAITKIDLGWDNGLSSARIEPTDDGFLALLANGARNKAARFHREGAQWRREWLTGNHATNLFDLRLGKDSKTLLYSYSNASTPEQWQRARLEGASLEASAQLTELNGNLQKKTRARTEVVRWKGALDDDVEGILYYPHDYQPGKRYPLVLMIHGGPASANLDGWDENWASAPNLMCQRGAFVLRPNYHGSTHYGLNFVESIANGRYYDYPIEDIEKGVDALIARGLVDADKLGTLGWSNGAILTIALVVHNPRYKAASAGAGGAEWVGDWGACEFGMSFSNYYFGKSPIEDPQLYIKMAPLYQFDKVRTPVLLIHGTEDRTVPTHDGWAQYRTLQQHGKAEVRFVLMPGEKHSLAKLAHQRRKLEEELAWFDRYLFKTAKNEMLAFKPDSPLSRALKLHGARRADGRYGVLVKDALVPETIVHDGLEIGRFEVTRAQFAQFDKGYGVEAGKEDFPANRISFEQAKAYCGWLSKTTGELYRLPTEEEAAAIYDKTDAAENTLDYWAGHAVNPDDAARLRGKLQALGVNAPLLREVGTFKGVGKDDLVFDLGGNVAEWVIGKDGNGKVMGGSADTPADAKQSQRRPAPAYIGLRVLKGSPATKKP
jgi:dipeptidyl aminopeptidase/acylaminoacyl peptidase